MDSLDSPLIHFETFSDRPPVFRITQDLISAAQDRNKVIVRTSVGEDLLDLSWLSTAVGLVTHNDVLTNPKFPLRKLSEVAPRLRWIHITGAGIEPLLPLDWIPQKTVLTNNSGVHADKIRESAAMMLLMLNSRVPKILSNQRKAHWEQIFTPVIRGKTVLIIGVGDMGGAAAQAGRQLGLRVLGIRRGGAPHPDVHEMYRIDAVDKLLPSADFVILAAPLTPETHYLMDRRRISLMKIGAGLINIGRAGLADYAALADSLRDEKLSGAILDVYDPEPLAPDSPLWSLDNIILMPHVTSDDERDYLPNTLDLAFQNFDRMMRGLSMFNIVEPERGY
jgi:phosphoglycerate dehydrogenase-like enzyme